jgi:hypothetical protein
VRPIDVPGGVSLPSLRRTLKVKVSIKLHVLLDLFLLF